MKRAPKRAVNKDAWINVYADMVTLLLCFFVLLFASSSIDSEKWMILVRSLNPDAVHVSQVASNSAGDEDNTLGTSGSALLTDKKSMDQLYWTMKEFIEQHQLSADVKLAKGDGYTFIVFRNNIFFDGDRYELKSGCQLILDYLGNAMEPIAPKIAEIRIFGHTNQADPNKRNDPSDDWFLSSARAAEVCAYLDKKRIIPSQDLVPLGCGQNYPIAPFVLETDRQQNRRVEILIAEDKAVNLALEEIYLQIDRDLDAFDPS